MKVDRRRFLQGPAAIAAAGMFGPNAWAEDPINVASIHDLSGGLDIYGKPMVDALTFAVEETNAAGGLLGRQIKLISYDTQSNMQLYTQFAQQAAIKDKVASCMAVLPRLRGRMCGPVSAASRRFISTTRNTKAASATATSSTPALPRRRPWKSWCPTP